MATREIILASPCVRPNMKTVRSRREFFRRIGRVAGSLSAAHLLPRSFLYTADAEEIAQSRAPFAPAAHSTSRTPSHGRHSRAARPSR